jgi:hypothetical protein
MLVASLCSRNLRTPLAISSDPASAFGPENDRRKLRGAHGCKRLADLRFALAVFGRYQMLTYQNKRLRKINSIANAELEKSTPGAGIAGEDFSHKVDARTADLEHHIFSLAEFDDAICGVAARGKMHVANFVVRCLMLSSMVPDTSPPMEWAIGIFMYAAASIVAMV